MGNACTMPSAWRCPHLAQDCPWRRRCPRCCCDRSGELRWRVCYLQNCEGENARCLANPAARAGEERTGLKDEDTWGQSDPYCVVEVDDVKKRTKTVDNNHDPVWNEELTLGVFKEHMDTNIKFGVWDDDHGGDEELGEVFVPLSGVSHSRKDFDLGMKQGSLSVTMWLTGE